MDCVESVIDLNEELTQAAADLTSAAEQAWDAAREQVKKADATHPPHGSDDALIDSVGLGPLEIGDDVEFSALLRIPTMSAGDSG